MHVRRAPLHEPHSSCMSFVKMWLMKGFLIF